MCEQPRGLLGGLRPHLVEIDPGGAPVAQQHLAVVLGEAFLGEPRAHRRRVVDVEGGGELGAVGAGAGARLRKSVLGDICEAVIGAIFLDGGYTAAAQFVERNWVERMRKPRRPLRDPKTILHEMRELDAKTKGLLDNIMALLK